MSPIILIAGSPAAGKSTAAQALAAQCGRGLHILVDSLRDMVQGGLAHPSAHWSAELVRQLELARHTAIDMALRYREAGFVVMIDDFWDPHSHLQEYAGLWAAPQVLRVILCPGADVAQARNHRRTPPSPRRDDIDIGIRRVHDDIEQRRNELLADRWQILDNADERPDETVRRIRALWV